MKILGKKGREFLNIVINDEANNNDEQAKIDEQRHIKKLNEWILYNSSFGVGLMF